ncbi:unnamed protein product, partial [marine sediment metagenome]
MNSQELVDDQAIYDRKEPRFKTCDDGLLRCETAVVDVEGLWPGTVVDLSKTGIRLLCAGRFEVGQSILTELRTDRSHGIYRGVVQRVEPWVNGQSILGCSLTDSIPESVLQDLAKQGAVNRRADGRMTLTHKATVNWPLNPEEIEVELQDYSTGGMKLLTSTTIPDDVRLRIRILLGQQDEVVVEGRLIWKRESSHGCVAGVAFTERDAAQQEGRIQA